MTDIPWEILMPVIESGNEEQKVEFKQYMGCSSKAERAEFAKRATAIANTEGETGYIVIGVEVLVRVCITSFPRKLEAKF